MPADGAEVTERDLPWDVPAAWAPALAAAREGGLLLLIGAVDSGKSTLAAVLAHAGASASRRVAVVDADIGQTSIGPPACVGMALVEVPPTALEDLPPRAISFVGACSPAGHLLELAAATHELVQVARREGAETIIVDTTGLVSGGAARALKSAKVRLLDADYLVAVQAQGEVEHLLVPYAHRARPQVLRLPRSRRAKVRTREERAARRQRRFASYLQDGKVIELAWEQAPAENSAWTTGAAAPGHIRAFAEEKVECEVLHAEVRADGLLVVVSRRPSPEGLRDLGESFGAARAVELGALDHLLVGLLGERGETLGMGVLEAVDFRAHQVQVFTPCRQPEAVRGLRLGGLRVAPDGTELGWLQPGSLA